MSLDLEEVLNLLKGLPPEKREFIEQAALAHTKDRVWVPNTGYQDLAYRSLAEEMFAGGEPGGGKSSLLVGTALTDHTNAIIFRREYPQIKGLEDEAERILGGRKGYNSQTRIWRLNHLAPGKTLEFGSVPHEQNKTRYQGRPHDYKGFDEITHFTRSQYKYLTLWLRSANPNQRCRIVATGNPPESPEGLWVIEHWRPWLDETYPDPAEPGELRWAAPISDNEDRDVFFRSLEEAIEHVKANLKDPVFYNEDGSVIPPRSRTFVPLPLDQNKDLSRTGYKAVLAFASKENRKLASGEFSGVLPDHPEQVIPTAWIIAAEARWTEEGWRDWEMTAMAFDPAGGGRDAAVLGWRHRGWYAPMVSETGKSTADTTTGATAIFTHRRDGAPVVIDVGGGYASGVVARLNDNKTPHVAFNAAHASMGKALGTKLKFANKRAEVWWRFREALDPSQDGGSIIALPPDPELRADLAAPRFKPRTLEIRGEILLESKDEIRQRLGRSPGKGDVAVMCLCEGNKAIQREAGIGVPGGRQSIGQSTNPNRSRYSRFRRGAHSYGGRPGGGEQG
jgi:hypothetical protein